MLLRHNSCLRSIYKNLSNQLENELMNEDSFSIDLFTFWKFV